MRRFWQCIEGVEFDLLLERIFASEIGAGKSLVDYGYVPRRVDISLGKQSAAQQAKAKRAKVSFTAQLDHGPPIGENRLTQDRYVAAVSFHRRCGQGLRGGDHAGDGLHALEDLIEEECLLHSGVIAAVNGGPAPIPSDRFRAKTPSTPR